MELSKRKSLKTITLKTIISVMLVAVLFLTIFHAFSFRFLAQKIIKSQVLSVSDIIKAGLTSHMKAGIMDKREYFLEEIKTVHNINRIMIIRSQEVNRQFGPGLISEQNSDETIQQVFKSKEPLFHIDEFQYKPKIRAAVPFTATGKGKLNCLICHNVPEGTVLGVVDMELEISYYRNVSVGFLIVTILISFILAMLIVINTFRTISLYVQEPLEHLIEKARDAYSNRKPVDENQYQSIEFKNVAKEINLFQSDILKSQNLLEEKNQELKNLNDEIEETLKETVFTMGVIEEQRSKETKFHTKRVTEYCRLIAEKLELSKDQIELITNASPLHDIGKVGISDYILLKNDRLTEEEFEIMKNHTLMGYKLLVHSRRELLQAAAIIAYEHHEKWDGSGYPRGLKGEEIHIFGRIVALADVFDALITQRAYKEKWEIEKVKDEILSQSGRHFDPAVVDVFMKNIERFMEINQKFANQNE
ncbi:MAG: HD domain-containing protein [Spirochaetia bacterium]|nr:HD domain-containing protein [Spirochaetia bacterium]